MRFIADRIPDSLVHFAPRLEEAANISLQKPRPPLLINCSKLLSRNNSEVALKGSIASRSFQQRYSSSKISLKVNLKICSGLPLIHKLLESLEIPNTQSDWFTINRVKRFGIRPRTKVAICSNYEFDLLNRIPTSGYKVG